MSSKRPIVGAALCALSLTILVVIPRACPSADPVTHVAGGGDDTVTGGPGPAVPDVFYPGFDYKSDELPAPKHGGRVIVHLPAQPKHMNYMLENSTYTRNMLYEAHEFLVHQDWESWVLVPRLAHELVEEDTVVLKGGRGENNANIHFGKVSDGGNHYLVTPVSKDNPLGEPLKVPKDEVESVQYGTAFTFYLRGDVKWHDGHPFDVQDVAFSMECYRNPNVMCDWIRFKMDQLVHYDVLGKDGIRFFYNEQYFLALDTFTSFTILPSHRYNLADPDNPDHDPDASAEKQGTYINEHPNNNEWVGLGPYRITEWSQQQVEAERFEDYFDKSNGGYLDTIRWRHISNDDAAAQALINGEVDFSPRVKTEDYFGELTQRKQFLDTYYKGYFYVGYMGYMGWNMRSPLFEDKLVRQAMGHCYNWKDFLKTYYYGLGMRVSGTIYRYSPSYNESVEVYPFDLEKAEEMLAEAGWYDHDGDGIIDKDGVAFEFEYLTSTGNKSSEAMAQRLQENLAKIGVRMTIATRDWASFLERVNARDFELTSLAWSLPVASDPFQLWHSSLADKRTSNHSGVADPEVDRLIEAIQTELDDQKRYGLFRDLHAYLYDLQPYNFGVNVPRKFAMSKKIRNFQTFPINPGYSIRRWYRVD